MGGALRLTGLTATSLVSFVPQLEPLAGVSLAINVAYMSLQRWRYGQKVRAEASRQLTELAESQDDDGATVAELEQFKGLKVLAGHQQDFGKVPFSIKLFDNVYGREKDVRLAGIFAFLRYACWR